MLPLNKPLLAGRGGKNALHERAVVAQAAYEKDVGLWLVRRAYRAVFEVKIRAASVIQESEVIVWPAQIRPILPLRRNTLLG